MTHLLTELTVTTRQAVHPINPSILLDDYDCHLMLHLEYWKLIINIPPVAKFIKHFSLSLTERIIILSIHLQTNTSSLVLDLWLQKEAYERCFNRVSPSHRHLRIYRLLNGTYCCLVCFISTVNDHCNNKKRKEKAYPWKASASSGHTTNLKQSILGDIRYLWPLRILDIYAWKKSAQGL